jgi:CspA family cold shock protein
MATGTVKWFNAQKGYGFIASSTGGPDVFVHISAVEQSGLSGLNDRVLDGDRKEREVGRDKSQGALTARCEGKVAVCRRVSWQSSTHDPV